MWSDVTPRQLGELAGMFTAFGAALSYGVTHIHQIDWHFWAFVGSALYASWVIGFHMKDSLWHNFSTRTQKWLRRVATAALVTIATTALVSSVASAAAHAPVLPEGPPCSAVYSPYAPLCSSSSEAWRLLPGLPYFSVPRPTPISTST